MACRDWAQLDVELEVAMELFQAADQFGVDRLKRMCESTMLASIEVENAASIFHAADERNAKVMMQLWGVGCTLM